MPDLTTDQKGNVAELAVAYAATKLGIVVFRPMGEGSRYDLIFDLGTRLLRVQCKWAPRRGEVVDVMCESRRRTIDGIRHRAYTPAEIDAIAAYCPELERCYLLPVALVANRRGVSLRLAPAKNNQRMGLHWAHRFDFSAIDWFGDQQLGAIAQLEERVSGTHEVVGSSPTSSTPGRTPAATSVGAEELRERLGAYLPRVRDGDEFVVTRRGRPYARLVPP